MTNTVISYIFISVEMESQRDVLDAVRNLDEVDEAHIIFGKYDIILRAEFKSNDDLSSFVVDKLRSIDGVGETQTNICATCT